MDRAKIKVVKKLPSLILVKRVRSFLRHVGSYQRFIKELPKIAIPLCKLLVEKAKFVFDGVYLTEFKCLKSI